MASDDDETLMQIYNPYKNEGEAIWLTHFVWFDERLEISLRNRTSRQNKHQNRPNHHQYDGMFEKDKNVMNFEPKLSSTTSKVCSQT